MRSTTNDVHESSNHEWWEMGARYHLKSILPNNPEIWNSLPNSTEDLRERDEDIRSRPLYANHIGAEELIHIHTNGDDNASTRGARVIRHADKPQDNPMAKSILCYMRELITAQDGYETFPIATAPHTGRQGEIRLAAMPSVIVEVAFHTNPQDALALQDPVFRTAAMKGVEKGARLHREGKGCEPLTGKPVEDINIPSGQARDIAAPFIGHPQYPVPIVATNTSCPQGWVCKNGSVELDSPDKPSQIRFGCRGVGTTGREIHVRDADGVHSRPAPFSVNCTQGTGSQPAATHPGTITIAQADPL